MHVSKTCLLVMGAWLAVVACSHPPEHHHNQPDTGATITPSEEPVATPIPCPVSEDEEDDVEPPRGACAPEQQSCRFGRECCCGRCAPNLVCECLEGQWACYFTDFCSFPSCSPGGEDAGGR